MSARDSFHVYLRDLDPGEISFEVLENGRHVLWITNNVQLYVRPASDDLEVITAGLRKLAEAATAMADKLDGDAS